MVYEKLVVVSTKQHDDRTTVTCRLPELQAGKILFKVDSVGVRSAEQKEIAPAHRPTSLSFSTPTEQLSAVTIDATYIDARAFTESARDADHAIDWSVRFYSFKLRAILEHGHKSRKL
jgi:hypothetical protein